MVDKRRGKVESIFPNGIQEEREGGVNILPNGRQEETECGGEGG